MGLSAFSIALLSGLSADNGADQILSRALVSMLACTALGACVGMVGERAAMDAIQASRAAATDGAAPPKEPVDDVLTV